MRLLMGLGTGALIIIGGFFLLHKDAQAPYEAGTPGETQDTHAIDASPEVTTHTSASSAASGSSGSGVATATSKVKVYSYDELLAMADNKYADGNLPLGDYKYTTDAAKKGYIYLCNARKDNPGSMVNGPWMHGETWNILQKVSVSGSVSWPQALFTNIISGTYRVLTGNDLPKDHTTGTFPVTSSDPAHQYDANPNTISSQTLKENIPANPVYHDIPNCMGGEVGVMLTGVRLFNGFDAGLRDAAAHEVQDNCEGHPQGSGEYHYHSLSSCIKDTSVETVIGFAYDGFPITGPHVAANKYLTTEDLDTCHGLTSEVLLDGKKVTTYHYVMTQDFPYSASCFRGTSSFKPSGAAPSAGTQSSGGGSAPQQGQGGQSVQTGGQPPAPPQEAITACSGKQSGASCTVGQGNMQGTCTTIGTYFACKPN